MKKYLLSLFAAFTMAATASAAVTFTCTAGKNFGQGEGIDKLFDGSTNTKYCGNGGSEVYALVTASEPVYVWGYEMTTANDNQQYGRCIKKWSLFGTNDHVVAANPNATGWVTLSDYSDKNYGIVWQKNFYTQRFFCEKGVNTPFKYFKLVLNDSDFIQFSEFKFLCETNRYVSYNWKESSSDNSKKAVDLRLDQKWEGTNLAADHNWFTIETADGQPHAVKKYSFTTHDDGQYGNRAPKSWVVEGSNDNSTWVIIDEVADDETIQNANYTTYEFTPANTTDEFRYVKVTLNAMKGTGWTQVGEFHVYSTTEAPAKKEYCEELIDRAKADPFAAETLGSDDPWYVEYKSLYDRMDTDMASSISAGNYDDLVAQLETMHKINALMNQFKNGANYVPFDGTPCWGDGHWSQLFDGLDGREGRKGTKWGGYFSGSGAVQYVIFRVKTAFAPYFYKLVTGGDTNTYKGRNWSSWNVYGANFDKLSDATHDATAWTLLDSRTNITEEYLPFENNYPAAFDFNKGVSQDYYYFMVEIVDSYTRNQGTQMNEMYLCTQAEFEETRAPLVAEFTEFFAGLNDLVIEASMADKRTEFATLYNELQTQSDPVRMTKVYNMLVALRAELNSSVAYMALVNATGATEGTEDFELSTAAQLVAFANTINSGRNSLNAVVTAEIDMTDVTPVLIGTQDAPYSGTFDGQGKAIKNFTYANTAQNNVALFAQTNGATIQNVLLTGANINGGANAAGIVSCATRL